MTGVNDSDRDKDQAYQISLTGENLDTGNNEVTAVALHNLDDDTDVTVALTSSDTTEATVNPATLTFTEGNWNTAQTVTLTGVDDNNPDGNRAYRLSLEAADQDADDPEVTTVAGSGTATFADGTGTAASFNKPYQMVSDGTNLSLIHI